MSTPRLLCLPAVLVALTLASWAIALPASAADGLLSTHRISAALANEAVAAAVAACAAQGYSETAVLVDADGVDQAVLRGDGSGPHTLDSAFDKAFTSVTFKSDTLSMAARFAGQPGPLALFAKVQHLLLLGGGVVIKSGDEVVGALGAGGAPGGDLDDACAKAGLAKISDRLK
jgi:uncharacterized protein GlcG (DUF336 family)